MPWSRLARMYPVRSTYKNRQFLSPGINTTLLFALLVAV